MSFHVDEDTGHSLSEINVTPLVDVMLVLLIVFMVTMPVMTHSISLSLPKAQQEAKAPIKDPIRLAISSSGEYFLGEKQVTLSELRAFFEQVSKQKPSPVLAVAADKSVQYEFLANALGVAQKSGIEKIGFITEQPNN